MQPVRHALGALLLDQGQLAEAESVYRADLCLVPLQQRPPCPHPNNPWSLRGLVECLKLKAAASGVQDPELPRLEEQLARVVPDSGAVLSSCMCSKIHTLSTTE